MVEIMRWKRAKFRIAANENYPGTKDSGEREGYVSECFAIHKGKWGACWVLTHLPSGLRTGERERLRDAKALADVLLTLPIDWACEEPLKGVLESVRAQTRKVALGETC